MKIRTMLAMTLFAIIILTSVEGFISFNIFTESLKENMIQRGKMGIVEFIIHRADKNINNEIFYEQNLSKTQDVFSNFFDEIHTDELIRIKVWDKDARIISSDNAEIIGQTFPDNKEFQNALKGEIETSIKFPEKRDNAFEKGYGKLMEIYVPIMIPGSNEAIGVIEAYFKLDLLNSQIKEAKRRLGTKIIMVRITLISILVLLGVFIHNSINNPIQRLIHFSKKVGKGNLNTKIRGISSNEMGELASSFNKMTQDLKKSTINIDELEKEVKKKTKQLQHKLEEMEKFNKVIVGRELKMIELKKKLKEVKGQ